jgi:hypothetical protein
MVKIVNYNLKIVFANKFLYFLLGALAFFLLVAVISLLDVDEYPVEADVYSILIFPGLLLIFYPSTFGLQNDIDTRMIELLFGIPNYRYRVWLIRLGIIYLTVYVMLFILCLISTVVFTPVPVIEMTFQLMFPIFFLGSVAFLFATILGNGNGAAALMIFIGLVFWISSGILEENRWNIFLNPFDDSHDINITIWKEMLFYNRLYLSVGTFLSILGSLYRLQKREKFV